MKRVVLPATSILLLVVVVVVANIYYILVTTSSLLTPILFDAHAPKRTTHIPHLADFTALRPVETTSKTDTSLRLAYLTYNKEQEGDFHAQYYATKIENMGPGRMSLNNDFAGVLL